MELRARGFTPRSLTGQRTHGNLSDNRSPLGMSAQVPAGLSFPTRKQGSHALLGLLALEDVLHPVALFLDREVTSHRYLVKASMATDDSHLPERQVGGVHSHSQHSQPKERFPNNSQPGSRNIGNWLPELSVS